MRVSCRVVLLSTLICGYCAAQEQGIDERATQVLQRLSKYYLGLKSATFEFNVTLTAENAQGKDSLASQSRVAFERPNKFAFRQNDLAKGVEVVSDGNTTSIFEPEHRQYVVEPYDVSIEEAVQLSQLGGATANFNGLISDLFGSDPAAAIADGASALKYVGEEELDGRKCDRIFIAQQDEQVEMWIASGEQSLLLRVAPAVPDTVDGTKYRYQIDLQNWNVNAPISPEQWVYTAPAGVNKVTSMAHLLGRATRPAYATIGQIATPFVLKQMGGADFDVGALLGKEVILLDFWATWCPPCIRSLPELAKLSDHYSGKGLRVFAVNQAETVEEITAFLTEKGLKLDVLLDSEGTVSTAYSVESLPTTVLIGKDGRIHAVHVGVFPTLSRVLRYQIDMLLQGKSLLPAN